MGSDATNNSVQGLDWKNESRVSRCLILNTRSDERSPKCERKFLSKQPIRSNLKLPLLAVCPVFQADPRLIVLQTTRRAVTVTLTLESFQIANLSHVIG
jgi:hypothetical protein